MNTQWMQCASGKAFFPLAPKIEDIDLMDIAHHLAMKCRYSGAVKEYFSVAQHSVLVSRHVPPEDALWGLLHDAAEAYLPDVVRPIKDAAYFSVGEDRLMMRFAYVEGDILRCISDKFGMHWHMPATVKKADLEALQTEKRDLLGPSPHEWSSQWDAQPWPEKIVPLDWREAKRLFLDRAAELGLVV